MPGSAGIHTEIQLTWDMNRRTWLTPPRKIGTKCFMTLTTNRIAIYSQYTQRPESTLEKVNFLSMNRSEMLKCQFLSG